MTIICVKDNVMAADTVTWRGDIATHRTTPKIVRIVSPDLGPLLFAAWGHVRAISRIQNHFLYYNSRTTFPIFPEDLGFYLLFKNELWWGDQHGISHQEHQPAAMGRCEDFARGCLAAGASAEEAVRLTIENTRGAGGEVQVMTWNTEVL